jgi:DNA-binding CsgD family transcriptional regulator
MDKNTETLLRDFDRKPLGSHRPADGVPNRRWSLKGDLNARDAEVWRLRNVEKLSLVQTAEVLGTSERTIRHVEKKQAYRDVGIAAAGELGYDPKKYVKNVIELTEAEKIINIGGEEVRCPENKVRLEANTKLGDMFGMSAPKQFDLKHTMSAMSDEEIDAAVDESVEDLDGHIRYSVTKTPADEAVIKNTVAEEGREEMETVVEPGDEPATGPAGAGEEEGGVL